MSTQPIIGTAEMEPTEVIDLDPRAEVRLMDSIDDFGLVLSDGGVEVVLTLPRTVEAWHLASAFAWRILAHESEIKLRSIGHQHGPLTGPVAWPRG